MKTLGFLLVWLGIVMLFTSAYSHVSGDSLKSSCFSYDGYCKEAE